MGDSGAGDEGSVVMGGGGACVDSGMVGERDYCRIPGWWDAPLTFWDLAKAISTIHHSASTILLHNLNQLRTQPQHMPPALRVFISLLGYLLQFCPSSG